MKEAKDLEYLPHSQLQKAMQPLSVCEPECTITPYFGQVSICIQTVSPSAPATYCRPFSGVRYSGMP